MLDGYELCEPCIRETRGALDDVVRLAATLTDPESLLPQRGSDSGRAARGYGSKSPANDAVIALTDWRSIANHRGEPDDVLGVLVHWGDRVRTDTGIKPATVPRTVVAEVRVLLRMFDWACRQEWAGRFSWEVTNIATLLRDIARENAGRAKLGRCPQWVDVEDGPHRCNYLLMVDPAADAVRCPRCGTVVDRIDWPQLAAELRGQ